MTKHEFRTAISFNNVKEAAVYFDHVIPFGFPLQSMRDYVFKRDRQLLLSDLKKSLLPQALERDPEFARMFKDVQSGYIEEMLIATSKDSSLEEFPEAIRPLVEAAQKKARGSGIDNAFASIEEIVGKFNLQSIPVSDPELAEVKEFSHDGDLSLVLENVRLVDADGARWDQIFEFRKDVAAIEKLRRLRVFAFENYTAKPLSFVEDDIFKRQEDYKDTVSKWGFDTKEGAITAVVNSKVLAGGSIGTLASLLSGQPIPALVSTLGAGSLEIARLGIYLAKRKFELRQFIKENPFSFFEYANSKLKAPSKDLRG
jgi:hypothetical protein